jgi:hypothetical protein
MPDQTASGTSEPVPYEDNPNTPITYFDICGANGLMAGAVQIELATRVLVPIVGTNAAKIQIRYNRPPQMQPGSRCSVARCDQ